MNIPQTPRFSVGIADGARWTRHSDHTAASDAMKVAAELRTQGVEARAFDWAGEAPAGTMLDPDHALDDRCLAHFWESASRCEHPAGHDGMHTVRGFASWGDDLSKFHEAPKLSGGLLDLLEDGAA
jgi:hypothetical protein